MRECRFGVVFAMGVLASVSAAQPGPGLINGIDSWPTHSGNPQHTNISAVPAQAMRGVLWSTAVDLAPQYSGSSLLMHYASPLVSKANRVLLTVKTGSQDGFKLECRNASDGSLVWTELTDYSAPPHNWMPTCEGTITPDGNFSFPAGGGTILRFNLDANSNLVGSPVREAFFGISSYNSDPTTFNTNVKIVTPISTDSAGNRVFGFRVYGTNPAGLTSGVARIAANGTGSWVAGTTLTGDVNAGAPGVGCAPAFSNDESIVYMGIRAQNNSGIGYMVAFNATTLAPIASKRLYVPGTTTPAYILDDSTSTPMVGPDGDVYYGAWYYNGYRGFLYHWNSDLSVEKIPGHFGWDITPSIVDADLVPSYTGTSDYLVLTKSNKYIEASLGGMNEVAVLDPNDTMFDVISGMNTMKEVLVMLAPTPDPRGGFIEWCVNTTAIDPATKSAVVNSEDGKCYRWDFTTNTLSEAVTLTGGLGEAYTSTIIGPDGLCYAMSNATVFALWDEVVPATVSTSKNSVVGGDPATGTILLSDNATGPGARIYLSDDNAAVTLPAYVDVPAGQNSVTFPISTTSVNSLQDVNITAERYGNTSSALFKVRAMPILESVYADFYNVVGGTTVEGHVKLTGGAPVGGILVNLSSNNIKVGVPPTVTVLEDKANRAFNVRTDPVGSTTAGTVTATSGAVTVTMTFTLQPGGLTGLTVGPNIVEAGGVATATIKLTGPAPAGGAVVQLTSSSAAAPVPATVTIPQGESRYTVTILTSFVARKTIVKITAKLGNTTRQAQFTIIPVPLDL